jgi:outer membrane protein OmpA-like peptidoglycan-associated protein
MRLSAIAALLAVTVLMSAAKAQTIPSVQQTIQALTPTGTLSPTDRGIKPMPPSGTATPAPSVNFDIDFESGSAALTPQAMGALDRLGSALTSRQLAPYHFKIAGYTDTVGDPATNQTLSEQRAAAVKTYLVAKFKIASTRLLTIGLGETDLLVPTPPQTPEPQNRRVQIINLGQ